MLLVVVEVLAEVLVEGEDQVLEGLLARLQAWLEEAAVVVVEVVALVVAVEVVEVEVGVVVGAVAQVVASPWLVEEVSSLVLEVEEALPQRLYCSGSCNCMADQADSRCSASWQISETRCVA